MIRARCERSIPRAADRRDHVETRLIGGRRSRQLGSISLKEFPRCRGQHRTSKAHQGQRVSRQQPCVCFTPSSAKLTLCLLCAWLRKSSKLSGEGNLNQAEWVLKRALEKSTLVLASCHASVLLILRIDTNSSPAG